MESTTTDVSHNFCVTSGNSAPSTSTENLRGQMADSHAPCVSTDISSIICAQLPKHWRTNKALPHQFFVIDLDGVPDGTKVSITARAHGCPDGELRNSAAVFRNNIALFNDLRFVGKSGRGRFFDLIIMIHTTTPQVAIYRDAIKVTADGPRLRRCKRKAVTGSSGPSAKKQLLQLDPEVESFESDGSASVSDTEDGEQSGILSTIDEFAGITTEIPVSEASIPAINHYRIGSAHPSVIRHTSSVEFTMECPPYIQPSGLSSALQQLNILYGPSTVNAALLSYLQLFPYIPPTPSSWTTYALGKALYCLQLYNSFPMTTSDNAQSVPDCNSSD